MNSVDTIRKGGQGTYVLPCIALGFCHQEVYIPDMTSCFHNHDLTQLSFLYKVVYFGYFIIKIKNSMGKESLKILLHMFLEMGKHKEIRIVAFEYP